MDLSDQPMLKKEADGIFLNENYLQFGIMNPVVVPKEEDSTSVIATSIPVKFETESNCINSDITAIKDEAFEDIFPNEDKLFLGITKPVSSPKHRDVASDISSCTSTSLEPDFDSIEQDLTTIKSEDVPALLPFCDNASPEIQSSKIIKELDTGSFCPTIVKSTSDSSYDCNYKSSPYSDKKGYTSVHYSDAVKQLELEKGIPVVPLEKLSEKLFKRVMCNTLKRHKRIHSGDKYFMCSICHKTFSRAENLNVHQRIHSGDKPFKCLICDKGFSQSQHLKTHQRMHSGDKPFKCLICDKGFSQSQHLKTHQRMHSGDKPFKCLLCDKRFSQSQHLKKHQRMHSGDKPFKCLLCDKRFSSSSNLKTHQRIHTGDKPFKCLLCDKDFLSLNI
ncbi:zinc finger protein 287-like isoform X1 [Artemia franciscana]|uniref:zinc finger protein 287-like isoform X1 n=1 Tax=Artemia franciscana TaxID=6661 RepID=UPI0032DAFEDC